MEVTSKRFMVSQASVLSPRYGVSDPGAAAIPLQSPSCRGAARGAAYTTGIALGTGVSAGAKIPRSQFEMIYAEMEYDGFHQRLTTRVQRFAYLYTNPRN